MSYSGGKLSCQKDKFSLPDEITYLNCAYFSPSLRSVEDAGMKGIALHNHPYRIMPEDFFEPMEALKTLFSRLINAPDSQRIAVIPSVSYGVSTVMHNVDLTAGNNIVILESQFPSNVYAYLSASKKAEASVRVVKAPYYTEDRGSILNRNLIEAIDHNTSLVAIPHVHWSDGLLIDLLAVRDKCDQCGALMIIDGTQSIGAFPFDTARFRPDALICAGYKWLLGPYSIGLAYYGPHFDNGDPIEHSWINRVGSDNFTDLVNFREELRPKAFKYNVGECSNFILIPMLMTALQQILDWGVQNIADYCESLIRPFLSEIEKKGYSFEKKYRVGHLTGIYMPQKAEITSLMKRFQQNSIFVSFRGKAIRISPHVYNNEGDFVKLFDSL